MLVECFGGLCREEFSFVEAFVPKCCLLECVSLVSLSFMRVNLRFVVRIVSFLSARVLSVM